MKDDPAEWNAGDGLFSKRWAFWKERFGEVEGIQGGLLQTKERAGAAKRRMEEIERLG